MGATLQEQSQFPKLASSLLGLLAGSLLAFCGFLIVILASRTLVLDLRGYLIGAVIAFSGCLRLALPVSTSRVSVVFRILMTAAYIRIGLHIMTDTHAWFDLTKSLLAVLFLVEGIQDLASFARIRRAGLVSADNMRLLHGIQSMRGNGALLISGLSSLGVVAMFFIGWPSRELFDLISWVGLGMMVSGASRATFSATLRRLATSEGSVSTPLK
jgi:hypothetical protein